MEYVADLHLHSAYARATSKELSFENLAHWAKLKGIDLLASADFTHPVWSEETRRKLTDLGNGLYEHGGVRFVLGTEVNCATRHGGKGRRVHMLLFAPGLDTVARINAALAGKSDDLEQDGRPTLQMSPRDLLTTALDLDSRCLVIPAHVWTPWYGVFGSFSGFDSLEECFGDMAEHIHAVETGLSSDPAMCWRVPELDSRAIVSFSDAHSLPRLGREATVFEGELSYDGLVQAIKAQRIAYTVEFFPEEGRYHYSGHREHGVRYSPEEVQRHGQRCPVCGRRLTLGVTYRVEQLARRQVQSWVDEHSFTRADNGRPPYIMLVGLQQVIAESLGVSTSSKKVQAEYTRLLSELGAELVVLKDVPVAEVQRVAGPRVAEGIARVRRGDISIEPGYDGLYGIVKVWPDSADTQDEASQGRLPLQ